MYDDTCSISMYAALTKARIFYGPRAVHLHAVTIALLLFLVGLLSFLRGFVNSDSMRHLDVAASKKFIGRTTAVARAVAATRKVAVVWWPASLAISLLVLKCVSKLRTSFQRFRYHLHPSYAWFVGLPYLREPLFLHS